MKVVFFGLLLCAAMALRINPEVTTPGEIPEGHTLLYSREKDASPRGWQVRDRAAPLSPHKFVIALKQNEEGVKSLKEIVDTVSNPKHPNYAHYLTTEQIRSLTSAREEHVEAVSAWLTKNGVKDFAILSDSIRAQAPVAVVEKLFNARMHTYYHVQSGRTASRLLGAAHIPKDVDSAIDFITNIVEMPIVRKIPRKNAKVAPAPSLVKSQPQASPYFVYPTTLSNMYGINATLIAPGNSMGVVEFGGNSAGFVQSDWTSFFTQIAGASLPGYPKTFGSFTPGGDPNLDTECTLDIEYIQALSNVTSWFWTIDQGWVFEMANSLAEQTDFPLVASVSYGWGEGEQCDVAPCKAFEDSKKYVLRSDTELAKLAAKGISVIVASGDTGAQGLQTSCGDPKYPVFNPDYPGNSPYVTGVGATMLSTDDTQDNSNISPYCSGGGQFTPCSAGTGTEIACQYPGAKITSGGGFSAINSAPSWQTAATAAYIASGVPLPPSKIWSKTGRGSPDVSFLGHNYLIYDTNEGGQAPNVFPVDGTSASAPGFAAVVSLLNNAQLSVGKKPLGFLNPWLYQNPSMLNDITSGDNKCTEQECCPNGYVAAKGWDPLTGLGTPNFPKMVAALP